MNTLVIPALTALADEPTTSFDIGTLISGMANSVTSNIGVVMGAVSGIIATVVGINFAIRMFKKHAKG